MPRPDTPELSNMTINNGSILGKLKYDKNNQDSKEIKSVINYNSFSDVEFDSDFDLMIIYENVDANYDPVEMSTYEENSDDFDDLIYKFNALYNKNRYSHKCNIVFTKLYRILIKKYGIVSGLTTDDVVHSVYYLIQNRNRILFIFQRCIARFILNLIYKNSFVLKEEISIPHRMLEMVNNKFNDINKAKGFLNIIYGIRNQESSLKINDSLLALINKAKLGKFEKIVLQFIVTHNSFYNIMNLLIDLNDTSTELVYFQIIKDAMSLNSEAADKVAS